MSVFRTSTDQPVFRLLDSNARLLADGKQTDGGFSLIESTGMRGHGTPRHRHLLATETFILLEGEMLMEFGDERREAVAGDVAVLTRGVPHSFAVVSSSVRYLTLHTPAGFELFVRDLSEASVGGPADPGVLTAVAAQHGIEILGPGVALPE